MARALTPSCINGESTLIPTSEPHDASLEPIQLNLHRFGYWDLHHDPRVILLFLCNLYGLQASAKSNCYSKKTLIKALYIKFLTFLQLPLPLCLD